ncbi:hypothetical protein ABT282_08520 [Streptomyces sp. NPDC000927]|uniref:hypothetical protein n=1 Tax=Streptomyces sp. NPDC000927 TaxID=3154371 RepID=UPI00332F43E4
MTETTENDWLLVTEALEEDGWIGDDDNPLQILRKNGAVWAVINDSGEAGLSGDRWTIEFPTGTPTAVIIAACLASTETPA